MSSRKFVFAALAAALLVAGLTGCRSTRRTAQAQPQAAQPAPSTAYPSYGPSQAPTVIAQSPSRPAPPSGPVYSSPGTPNRTVRPMPSPNQGLLGSPDGDYMGAPGPANGGASSVVVRPSSGAMAVPSIIDGAEQVAKVDGQIDDLRRQLDELRNTLDEPEVVPEAPVAGFAGDVDGRAAAFASTLRSRVSGEVVHTGNVVIVRLEDAFQSGSDQLKKDPTLVATLLHTAEALQSAGAREVLVVGHTDSDPIKRSKWPSNKVLSEARAQRVAAELSRRGVPAGSLEVIGEGSNQPLVPDNTKANKAKNRRVEVHVRF